MITRSRRTADTHWSPTRANLATTWTPRSISIVDHARCVPSTSTFDGKRMLRGMRGRGCSPDVGTDHGQPGPEPEYIAVIPDGRSMHVTLQDDQRTGRRRHQATPG